MAPCEPGLGRLLDAVSEAAALLDESGRVLYANRRLHDLLGAAPPELGGARFTDFVAVAGRERWWRLAADARAAVVGAELELVAAGGSPVQTRARLQAVDEGVLALVLAPSLAEERAQAMGAEAVARSILEQAAEAVVVCDERGFVVRANRRAVDLCGANPIWRRFADVFPLASPATGIAAAPAILDLAAVLERGETLRARAAVLWRGERPAFELLVSAGPMCAREGRPIGGIVTMTDVTARKRVEAERDKLLDAEREARAQAEAANRAKDQFVAMLSHELRTPLSAILGWVHVIRDERYDHAAVARGLEVIERNARSQVRLIDDLLDLSRISTGRFEIDSAPLDLATVLETCLAQVSPLAERKRIELQGDPRAVPATVIGDAARLQQVFSNVLANAIKFTGEGGRVSVRTRRAGDRLHVAIIDNGIGIAPKFLPFVFDRFRQADSSLTRSRGGLGLGLSIARQIVERHGGAIVAESPGQGGGATFTIELPLAPIGATVDEPIAAELGHHRGEADVLASLRVLLVEDDEDTLNIVSLMLRGCGADVVAVESAPAALRALERAQPHVLVSDIAMPVASGYDLMRRLRQLEVERGWRPTPAVALTAHTRDDDRREAFAAGFAAHVPKPVDPHRLVGIIARLAGRLPDAAVRQSGPPSAPSVS